MSRNIKISINKPFDSTALLVAYFDRMIDGRNVCLAVTRRSTMSKLDVTHVASGRLVARTENFAASSNIEADAVQKANEAIDALITEYGENHVAVVIASAY